MPDSLLKSVEKVIDTIRGRRGPSDLSPIEPAEVTPPPPPPPGAEIEDDVPQLHLSATVAEAAADDD